MDNYNWPFDVLQYRLKTARQRKRLQKKDLDKQVIRIIKKREELYKQRRALPWVPLKNPYQKGWKRYFILKQKEMNLPSAEFYQVLLSKINTFQYAGDALFKVKKGRKKRRVLEDRPQLLKAFSEYEWNSGRSGLSEDEKLHFHIYECPGSEGKAPEYKYRFNDPGRFKLIIVPNIISEVKLLDEQLEQDIDLLKNLITARNLDARINKLTGGGYHYWKWADFDKPRYLESERQALLEMSTALEIKRDQYFKRNEHFKNKRTK